MRCLTLFTTATALFISVVSAVEYVKINGGQFVTESTGDRFEIIGVTYQPGGSSGFDGTSDPLTDADACLRDAILMQQLGVNTVRVYNVAVNVDHDECVSIFNAAGMYLLIDVNTGLSGQYLDRSDPSTTYTLAYLEHVFKVVEAFWSYPNVLGFFAGNEIINEDSTSEAPSYIRAVVRDMKEYISLHAPRTIGVGYAAADVDTMLTDTWNYLDCYLSNSTYSQIDFFGLNNYEWCGASTYTESGYDSIVSDFAGNNIPVFFSEYGCNNVRPRTFTNIPALYGDIMTELSGGLAYEYSEESSDYGLVAINSTTEVTLLEDYLFLTEEFLKIDMDLIQSVDASLASITTTTCSAALVTETGFSTDWDLPDRPSGGDSLVTSGLTSASQGSLTSVTETAMPVTVYNYTGSTVTGYNLVSMGCSDINYPGLVKTYTATAQTCSYATSTSTSSASSGSGDSSSATSGNRDLAHSNGLVLMGTFVAVFLATAVAL
ncbi:beta-glucanosyltransferase gel2 [Ophiostoma piceae UAMH 11346]|uniref:1,3-beta-glucanosyltransferase n=1 Tax=Ophiostoma piceae (strain UAMH 11346) TaxID=1262450 RepID=S3D6I8_OPHP1|nr:beta-glucanosyltransferase gel2 [Ophiostoma piceae UAMH 11346]